jgi:hypothetical protein
MPAARSETRAGPTPIGTVAGLDPDAHGRGPHATAGHSRLMIDRVAIGVSDRCHLSLARATLLQVRLGWRMISRMRTDSVASDLQPVDTATRSSARGCLPSPTAARPLRAVIRVAM